MPADVFGDLLCGDPFVIHGVVVWLLGAFLQCQTEGESRVEAMDGGPAVGSVTDVGGNAFFAGGGDEPGNETVVVAFAMDRRREAHGGYFYTAGGQGCGGFFGGDAGSGGLGFVVLGGEAT